MKNAMFTKVQIGDKAYPIRYSNRAAYRIGIQDKPTSLSDLRNKKRATAALIQWVWACLIDEGAAAFETPEDLAAAVSDGQLPDLFEALSQAIYLSTPKNADSSTPAPSPASS